LEDKEHLLFLKKQGKKNKEAGENYHNQWEN